MSTTSPIGTSYDLSSMYSNPNALTADSLLVYCQTQLQSLDGTVQTLLADQTAYIAGKRALGDIQQMMKNYPDGPGADSATWEKIKGTFEAAKSSLPPESSAYQQVDSLERRVLDGGPEELRQSGTTNIAKGTNVSGMNGFMTDTTVTTLGTMTKADWASFTAEVGGRIDNMNASAELNMIQIQSYVSQRQTAVQLTTSILQKINDTSNAIVSNIGR